MIVYLWHQLLFFNCGFLASHTCTFLSNGNIYAIVSDTCQVAETANVYEALLSTSFKNASSSITFMVLISVANIKCTLLRHEHR